MTRYHIGKDGRIRVCKAKAGSCPLGENSLHFETKEDAQNHVDFESQKEFGLLGLTNEWEQELNQEDEDWDDYDDCELAATEDYNSLFNTDSYLLNDSVQFMKDDLDHIIKKYSIKPRGEVASWVVVTKRLSHYGPIANHGKTGYTILGGDNLVNSLFETSSDSFTLSNEDGLLKVKFYDHDGVHVGEIKPVSRSKFDTFRNKIDYATHEEKLKYLEKLPSIKIKKKYQQE